FFSPPAQARPRRRGDTFSTRRRPALTRSSTAAANGVGVRWWRAPSPPTSRRSSPATAAPPPAGKGRAPPRAATGQGKGQAPVAVGTTGACSRRAFPSSTGASFLGRSSLWPSSSQQQRSPPATRPHPPPRRQVAVSQRRQPNTPAVATDFRKARQT